MRLSLRVSAFALAAAAAAPLAAADLTLVWKLTGKDDSTGYRTQYISASRMRNTEGDKDFVADFASGRITMIDHKKREYSEASIVEIEASMQKAGAQMQEANAKMQEALAKMPPELREKLGGGMGAALAVSVARGGTRKILGYDAQQYTLSMGDVLKTETWNTKALALPVQDPGAFRRLSAVTLPMMQGMDKVVEEMKKIEGVSLAETTSFKLMGHARQTSSEVTEIRKDPIPASTFDLAAIAPGYRKVDSPLTRMGKRPQK